jgi:hypothetical protein
VPFIVVAQQYLGYSQTDQLRVADRRRATHPTAGRNGPVRRDDVVIQLHVECDQKGVQVGVHAASMVGVGLATLIMDTLPVQIT